MTAPVRITVPPSIALFVKPDTPLEQRIHAAGGDSSLPACEELMLLFCLSKDREPLVRDKALETFSVFDMQRIACIDGRADMHPAVLHFIAVVHGTKPGVREMLLKHPLLADATKNILLSILPKDDAAEEKKNIPHKSSVELFSDADPDSSNNEAGTHDGAVVQSLPDSDVQEEDGEEYLSKYQLAQVMGMGEKIKMALTGDKEWRKILIKDANKLVSGGVLKNPRITEPEVLNLLKSGVQNDEVMRIICANKEWVKNYQIRKALVENPKTPLASALRYLGTMNDKDLANYAKSKNISSVISTQAKRMLLNKQHK
mgnify:CR=1 FL=1